MGVAQLDRASGYGPEGREFESSRPRAIMSLMIAFRVVVGLVFRLLVYIEGMRFDFIGIELNLSLIHISEPTRQESRSRMPSSA